MLTYVPKKLLPLAGLFSFLRGGNEVILFLFLLFVKEPDIQPRWFCERPEAADLFKMLTDTLHTSAYVSICQHTSSYVIIRQHMSASMGTPCHIINEVATWLRSVGIRQHTSAYVSYGQHTSTSACVIINEVATWLRSVGEIVCTCSTCLFHVRLQRVREA